MKRSLWILFLLLAPHAGFAQDMEYRIKAEFLERFTRFIEWPADSTVSDTRIPFHVCVIGKNPFGVYLEEMAEDVKIRSKYAEVLEIENTDRVGACDLLFIPSSESERLQEILEKTADQPILTVGDSQGFSKRGVLINFLKKGNRIQFEVNSAAAKKSRLRFSSRLMALAVQQEEEKGD